MKYGIMLSTMHKCSLITAKSRKIVLLKKATLILQIYSFCRFKLLIVQSYIGGYLSSMKMKFFRNS